VEGNGMEEQMERKDVALEWNGSGIWSYPRRKLIAPTEKDAQICQQ
jgi:hypothetical protein